MAEHHATANHAFIVRLARECHAGSTRPATPPRLLDYGCGAGDLVTIANQSGLDAYGVDSFYDGGSTLEDVRRRGLLGNLILELDKDGLIPYPNNHFDIVTSNMVFEHLPDLDGPVAEISRVLRPGGVFINLFPTLETWREGHTGIPFAHRFEPGSKWRLPWAKLVYRLGGGYFRDDGDTIEEWSRRRYAWIDAWTHYRRAPDVEKTLAFYFDIKTKEADYLADRLARHPSLHRFAGLARIAALRPLAAWFIRRLATRVYLLRKPPL